MKLEEVLDGLRDLDHDGLWEVSYAVRSLIDAEHKKKTKEILEDNKKYVGRYYVQEFEDGKKKIYKVISHMGSNKYRVACLVFDENPVYEFVAIDDGSANYWFDGVYIDDPMIKDLVTFKEITEEEYQKYYNEYWSLLYELKWEM